MSLQLFGQHSELRRLSAHPRRNRTERRCAKADVRGRSLDALRSGLTWDYSESVAYGLEPELVVMPQVAAGDVLRWKPMTSGERISDQPGVHCVAQEA